ncbi:uncharacterized protein BP5553_00860 [Venustampulla echinocandica]|uniref:FAD-binding FR-type domain-containing protein n=1 Tax=Venustampulla echinocandica TaxID=2656787 RepID=A0A370TZC2_9HELO|nr:uncharacterized protein BP5553_00860 [Venustampulla echinocandica]RDL40881.1 hypothetical protein BP5553_00860 [Venustampulla echinocandica]
MILFLVLLTISGSLVSAQFEPPDFCFSACRQVSRAVQFNTTNPETGKPWVSDACHNELRLSSLYLCARIFCTQEERARGTAGFNQTCLTFSNTTLPPYSLIEDYTDDDIGRLYHVQPEDVFGTTPTILNKIVVPSEKIFQLAFNTLDAAHFEKNIHILYGYAMYYFWIVVISIGLCTRFARLLITTIGKKEQHWQPIPENNFSPGSAPAKWKTNIFSVPYTLMKRYITVPATFGVTHAQAIRWCTIPTRVQSLTIAVFVVVNIVLCSIDYYVFQYNMYWPDVSTQVWRYLADRTGIISTANLALIWAFGIRNNTLLWLTGWDFATYNNFHRWVARVATVEAVVHSVAYTVLILQEGSFEAGWKSYVEYYHTRWFVAGILATIVMVAICCFSVYGLRRSFYEVFLLLHIVLSILLIVTMWYHVEIFDGEYKGYIWPCIFIWLFDRFLRLVRVLLFNPKFWNTKAMAIYDSNSNIIRLVVPYSTSFVKPRPGTFYYVTSINSLKIWESHPFTLGYSTSDQENFCGSNSSAPSLGTISPPQRRLSPDPRADRSGSSRHSSSESQSLLDPSATTPPSSMVFIIRPYDGFTARLRDSAIPGPASVRMLIEGPYGETQPFSMYENVLFIVGGTGVTVPLSYMELLLGEEASTTSLRIVWAVREHEFLIDAVDKDFRGTLDNEKVSMTAYVTQADEADKDDHRPLPKGLQVSLGRPNIHKEVEDAARDSGHRPLAVVACGPGQMADDARQAVVSMLGRGWGQVEYFEESFHW